MGLTSSSRSKKRGKQTTMTMLSISGCLLLLLGSMASLASAQPMSLNECTVCTDSFMGAVETCQGTGSAEEVTGCVKSILDVNGQGDCKACICDTIPHFCQEEKVDESSGCNDDEISCGGGCCIYYEWCCPDGSCAGTQ